MIQAKKDAKEKVAADDKKTETDRQTTEPKKKSLLGLLIFLLITGHIAEWMELFVNGNIRSIALSRQHFMCKTTAYGAVMATVL